MPNCWYDDDKCMMMLGVFLCSLLCFTNAQATECLVTKIIPNTIPSVPYLHMYHTYICTRNTWPDLQVQFFMYKVYPSVHKNI